MEKYTDCANNRALDYEHRKGGIDTTALKGKVAVVTGVASGIGKETARRFADQGACVMLVDRAEDKLQAVCEAIAEEGGQAQAAGADIRVEAAMRRVFKQVDDTWGRLDVLFAHAGINGLHTPASMACGCLSRS